jgi:DNA-binding NtrC family response regulator
VREFENVVHRALLLSDDAVVQIASPSNLAAPSNDMTESYRASKARAIAAFEVRFLTHLMRRANGNVTAAASLVGTDRRHLGRLLKKHGLHAPASRVR